ncbi:E3 ubiquitin-protein ligase makorin [Phtheirospermum japonicum]|uniref:E3 ubiquitin-protein ligase makorin n=1 Tax=Phtheirospermum japonicum TaxID=374723 RepID=A0A830C1W9_9LAMI|nr:E3 ubiquitin-protein ligase makorin [Phtheirospermum japonicum]
MLLRRGRRVPARRELPPRPRRPLPDLREALPAPAAGPGTGGACAGVREAAEAAGRVETKPGDRVQRVPREHTVEAHGGRAEIRDTVRVRPPVLRVVHQELACQLAGL